MAANKTGITEVFLSSVRKLLGLMACMILVFSVNTGAEEKAETARPSVNGALRVSGTVLTDQNGREVILRGLSTHGLTWFPDFVDEELFRHLSTDWNCSLIRLAMYSDIYYSSEKDKKNSLSLLKKGLQRQWMGICM